MKLLLIKRSSLLCDGMMELLRRQFPDCEIRHCNETNEDVLIRYGQQSDLIIIDIQMPVPLKQLANYYQSIDKKVIAWVEDLQDPNLASIFELALSGYIYYDVNEKMLTEAISRIHAGKRFFHPLLADCLLDIYVRSQHKEPNPPLDVMSQREWEVLQLLAKGYSNIKIANELFLSDKTVKNYVSSILQKLNVPDRTNAVLLALKKQWVHL
ncbi:response regulator transcription factor [Amphibacillus sp. MSJ-3]|uniref:response regulator transcription factor n=1 Tax=Amphibacillus sp. MSJ-3 TaxID=2841505 RepID=UPI001C0EBE9B|nr:response regulator transcription factor [Amphibacillus sp. MSJ-3]MBU5595616.1 response regulator transcription factor [Amphibacillus sp. MSJ-3]